MSAKKPPYPAEFRRQAIALVQRNPDKSIPDLAQELGVSHQSLRNWLLCRSRHKSHYAEVRIMPTSVGKPLVAAAPGAGRLA
jgi:transposase-like protein